MMVNFCCVPMCSSSGYTPNTTMFSFTKDKKLKKIWLYKIRVDTVKSKRNGKPFVLKANTKICSHHFLPTDIRISSEKNRLKLGAIPTIFPWTISETRNSPKRNRVEALQDSSTSLSQNVTSNENVQEAVNGEQSINNIEIDQHTAVNLFVVSKRTNLLKQSEDLQQKHELALVQPQNSQKPVKTIRNVIVDLPKTMYVRQYFTIEFFQHDNNKIAYYTGFPDYETFELSLDILFGVDRTYNIKRKLNDSNIAHRQLGYKDEYFLVLMKLRHDYDYEHLATLFNLSTRTVENIFISLINYMYIKFASLDMWPHRNILLENYNDVFKENYPNVLGSLNATEFFCQTPSSLVKQSQAYSQYKGHNTVKGLIVTDANGAIIFISPLFTGSNIPDKRLVQQCGLLTILESKIEKGFLLEGDIFLADKGFTIQDLVNPLNININIPVFRMTGVQFSPDDVSHTQERIHVDKAFARLKQYKLLSHSIPISFMEAMNETFNQIWAICCMLSNFINPLRK